MVPKTMRTGKPLLDPKTRELLERYMQNVKRAIFMLEPSKPKTAKPSKGADRLPDILDAMEGHN